MHDYEIYRETNAAIARTPTLLGSMAYAKNVLAPTEGSIDIETDDKKTRAVWRVGQEAHPETVKAHRMAFGVAMIQHQEWLQAKRRA